jgi:hypothetical protein
MEITSASSSTIKILLCPPVLFSLLLFSLLLSLFKPTISIYELKDQLLFILHIVWFDCTLISQSAVSAELSLPIVTKCNPGVASIGIGSPTVLLPELSVVPLATNLGPSSACILLLGVRPETSTVAFFPCVAFSFTKHCGNNGCFSTSVLNFVLF